MYNIKVSKTCKPLPLWQWANVYNAPRERLRWQADNQGNVLAFERTVRHG